MTRLGQGVDASGRLGDEPIARTLAVVDRYRDRIEALGADAAVAVLTSAVRDAANGADLTGAVAERGFEARTITGDEEAALTFRGATSERAGREELVVIDIGGGSTELVTGHGPEVDFHVSMQAGVVRLGERHLHDDPPDPDEVASLVEDFRATLAAQLPDEVARSVQAAIAVAGTPTSAAAIELELDPYDPARVHGHVLELATLEEQLAFLAAMPLEQRREVTGLHPDRAPTIVAGVAMLMEMRARVRPRARGGLRARHPPRGRAGARGAVTLPIFGDCIPGGTGRDYVCRARGPVSVPGTIGSGVAALFRRLPPSGPLRRRPCRGTYPCPS